MSKAIISIEAHGNKTTVEIPSDSNIDGYVADSRLQQSLKDLKA